MEGVFDIDKKQLTSNNVQCINKNPLTTIIMQLKYQMNEISNKFHHISHIKTYLKFTTLMLISLQITQKT